MITIHNTVTNEVGLHARPASVFVQNANKFKSKIEIKNLTTGKGPVNAKSILILLSLAVANNNEVEITFDGEDEVEASQKLGELLDTDFEGYL